MALGLTVSRRGIGNRLDRLEAAVANRKPRPGLCAFLETSAEPEPTQQEIQATLARDIPEHVLSVGGQ
jgi:hypothetical protein